METTKQIFIGITITTITIFVCSQFIKFEINSDKKKAETEDSVSDEKSSEMKLRLHRSKSKKNKKRKPMTSNNKIKSKQNEDSHIQDKNELLNKLEKLFSKRNYKIVEKIITQMLEESEHEKYLEWLSNQENNIYIKTLSKDKKNQKLNKSINICVVSKKDIVPGEIIYTEKPVVSILNPYLDKEEYCPTCFKKITLPDNVEEKKENFCSKECELKSKEDKRLFHNIFTSDETSEKSYVSSMSSCYGISTYDIESEIIYYDNPEVETIHVVSTNPEEIKSQMNASNDKNSNDQNNDNQNTQEELYQSNSDSNVLFYYTNGSGEKENHIDLNNNNNKDDVEIIKVGDNNNHDEEDEENEDEDEDESDQQHGYTDIDKESFLQFFDSKTKSTTTSGVNEKIVAFYQQLCWEKEYFYPLLILKLLILIIQDELCFKKKIKLLDISNCPLPSNNQHLPPLQYQKSPRRVKINNNKNNNNKPNVISPPSLPMNYNQKSVEKPVIYTLWDHIETFPYIENYSKSSSNLDLETNNEFSNNDLKFFNLIHTLFYDVFYEFEDFFTDDMYQILKQKVLYNTIGITSNDTIEMKKKINDIYRTDNNKSVIGLGVYFISSYIRHRCHPNAKICYLNNNNTLSLISTQYIKKGEEITISYIDTHNKSHKKCHEELYNKFKIKCFCNK